MFWSFLNGHHMLSSSTVSARSSSMSQLTRIFLYIELVVSETWKKSIFSRESDRKKSFLFWCSEAHCSFKTLRTSQKQWIWVISYSPMSSFLLYLECVRNQKSRFFRGKMMRKKVFDFDVLKLAEASECSESIRFDEFEWIWASETAVLQEKRNKESSKNHQNEDFWQSSKNQCSEHQDTIIRSFDYEIWKRGGGEGVRVNRRRGDGALARRPFPLHFCMWAFLLSKTEGTYKTSGWMLYQNLIFKEKNYGWPPRHSTNMKKIWGEFLKIFLRIVRRSAKSVQGEGGIHPPPPHENQGFEDPVTLHSRNRADPGLHSVFICILASRTS
jgi:hypothetical protein